MPNICIVLRCTTGHNKNYKKIPLFNKKELKKELDVSKKKNVRSRKGIFFFFHAIQFEDSDNIKFTKKSLCNPMMKLML